MSFWDEKEVKRLFKELPFYNVAIEIPYIKRLNNINLLRAVTNARYVINVLLQEIIK